MDIERVQLQKDRLQAVSGLRGKLELGEVSLSDKSRVTGRHDRPR